MSAADEIDAELERRRERVAVAARAAAQLRERFAAHPKQERFWRSTARRLWALCTRRAGKSDGGVREWLAKAITIQGWRGLYVHETKAEARRIAWTNDMHQGWLDLISQYGKLKPRGEGDGWTIGGVDVTKNETTLEINFSNGSQIAIFCADDEGALERVRGVAKDEIWVDEAQKFQHLRKFVEEESSAILKDKRGRLRLTGTPSEDCAGYFYACSPEPDSGEMPLPGWDGHRWSVIDNPHFGRVVAGDDGWYVMANGEGGELEQIAGPIDERAAADKIAEETRWTRTAGEELELNQWTGEESKFKREWLGQWVKGDARYVYPVHAVPAHVLVYAPQRLVPNPIRPQDPPWIDLQAALADLPVNRRAARGYQWMTGLGVDFGYWPDPFALVAVAFNYELADVFELFSWKAVKVDTDAQGVYMRWLFDALPNLVSFVGDTAGKEKIERWEERMNLTFDVAQKADKNALEDFLANDIRLGRYHFRGRRDGDPTSTDSPLLTEMRHLVYLPAKPGKTREVDKFRAVAGVVHGDHCCFVAGTMVATPSGERAIEALRVGDAVITRAGPRAVSAAWCTGVRDLWRLETDDGRTLIGTADHPVWVGNAWRPLSALIPGDTLTTWEDGAAPRSSCSTGSATAGTRTHRTAPDGSTSCGPSAGQTGETGPSRCTARSGSIITDQCPPARTSTTSTATRSTTRSVTSRCATAPSTYESTAPRRNESPHRSETSNWPGPTLPPGTDLPQVARGTASTLDRSSRLACSSGSCASNAGPASSRSSSPPGSAASTARPPRAAEAPSTTRSAPVQNAEPSSGRTATRSPGAARSRVACVGPYGLVAPVYNVTITNVPEFFANGILVHNCDGARYLHIDMMPHLARAKPVLPTDPIERGKIEAERFERRIDKQEERARARAEETIEADDPRWGLVENAGDYGDADGYE